MNIGIDARVLEKRMTGIGRFLSELLKHIPGIDTKNRYFLFSYGKVDVGNDRYISVPTAPRFISSKLYSPLWLLRVLPRQLREHKIDMLFSPNFLAPLRRNTEKWKSIVVVCDAFVKLDVRYFSVPYTMYVNALLPRSIQQSAAIVTISEHSKKDLVRYYGVNPEKIHVIYPSASARFSPEHLSESRRNEIIKHFALPEQFILSVGVVEERKNVIGLTRIADILKRKGVRIPIVLIGGAGFGFKKIMKALRARDNILYLSRVGEEYLPDIYRMASAFVFPSYYEGFGIPPLEAMQSGVPVVTSNTSSLPEVVGEAGSMFHPDDADGFANEIIRLLEDRQYHRRRSEGGIAQARRFNAHGSAAALVQLFSIVGS
jgi:glycosyltransferase involved in cell wall biosynthesis